MVEHTLKELLKKLQLPHIPPQIQTTMEQFLKSYMEAASKSGYQEKDCYRFFHTFLSYIQEALEHPYLFPPFHKAIRSPVDYYTFGLDFVRPLLDFSGSKVLGTNNLKKINEAIAKRENVILLANHQAEIDPQIISLLIEKEFPQLAEEMIFVAGHRVTTDPLAIPFSMGRNLLCIYSKKYIDHPPEKKLEKMQHNQRTLKLMEELLHEGGKCIYIAPSGGRDRTNPDGVIEIASFDPQSIEMLYLISKQAATKTHFHTLALSTYHLLPPPSEINQTIGEFRQAAFAPAHLFFGSAIDMEESLGIEDKKERRKKRAQNIWERVVHDFQQF